MRNYSKVRRNACRKISWHSASRTAPAGSAASSARCGIIAAPNQWYLGFLLLDPAWRGRGMGSTAYWAFQHWAVSQGADSILLAVLAENVRGQRFWESLGFAQPRSYPARQIGLKRHVLIEYEKALVQ